MNIKILDQRNACRSINLYPLKQILDKYLDKIDVKGAIQHPLTHRIGKIVYVYTNKKFIEYDLKGNRIS